MLMEIGETPLGLLFVAHAKRFGLARPVRPPLQHIFDRSRSFAGPTNPVSDGSI